MVENLNIQKVLAPISLTFRVERQAGKRITTGRDLLKKN
jgi:hypothetical protein